MTEIWILSRWEGDFDTILGGYSTEAKATVASAKDFIDNFKDVGHPVEYNLYMATLDGEPETLMHKTVSHAHQLRVNTMSEKPELFVAFKIYTNGQVEITYKEKTITTELATTTTAMIAGALAIDAITQGAGQWIRKALDEIFKGEQKDESKED